VIRVVGQDLKESRRIGEQIVDVLNTVRGTSQASVFQEPPTPQISIEVDRAALARYGNSISDVASLISNGVGGEPIGQVYIEDRIYNITTRFPREKRDSPEALGQLLLTSSSHP
jgi:heavy metal efflux system protein